MHVARRIKADRSGAETFGETRVMCGRRHHHAATEIILEERKRMFPDDWTVEPRFNVTLLIDGPPDDTKKGLRFSTWTHSWSGDAAGINLSLERQGRYFLRQFTNTALTFP